MVGLVGFGRSIDYFVYQKFYDKNKPLDDDIILVNIPRSLPEKKYNPKSYRKRTTSLLHELNSLSENNLPKAIILDMIFTDKSEGMDSLVASVSELRKKLNNIYVVFDVAGAEELGLKQREEEHSMVLYDALDPSNRLLHTRASTVKDNTILGTKIAIVSYLSDIEISFKDNSGGSGFATALPLKVAADLNNRVEIPFGEVKTYDVPIGRQAEIDDVTYNYLSKVDQPASGNFDKILPSLKDKIIIIGSLKSDFIPSINISGPALIAWAIDDQLHERTNARAVLDNPIVVIGQVLFFSFLLLLFFGLLFKYIKSLQSKPGLIALFSFLLTILVMIGMLALILATDKIMMTRLTLWGILFTALLAWKYSLKFMVPAIAEGNGKYDVFISYSHANGDWVHKNIFLPLSNALDSDGEPLSIFYDKKSIGIGAEFTSKYMWAITNSKVFLPVFSEGYYDRNHCRNEVHLAVKRKVEKKIKIAGIAQPFEAVPEIYDNLNLIVPSQNEQFIDDIIATIIKTKEA